MMNQNDILFSKIEWYYVEANQRKMLADEVKGWNENQLLNTSVDDLCKYFVDKYRVDVPVLDRAGITVDSREKQIDDTGNPLIINLNPGQPAYVDGIEIEVTVPFTGDAAIFTIQHPAYSLNPSPRGNVKGNILTFLISGTNLDSEEVNRQIDRTLDRVDRCLTRISEDAGRLNSELDSIARNRIEQRCERLRANQNLVASLGYKLKQREDAPETYRAPEVHRKITPTPPPASSMPYKPEPALDDADYEHILEVIENMVQVMERSPSAFSTMDEESLRSHFLVQLNGHYEGQATGETFNYEGKTDILIRSEGKNIFIAECKYWRGPKSLLETIDQLLSYSSWRDTKVAVIVFNRNKGFTKVLETIKSTTKEHPNYKRELDRPSETSFRFIFAHRDDPNRELTLTIMAFDIPETNHE